jgi:hypothetical protein
MDMRLLGGFVFVAAAVGIPAQMPAQPALPDEGRRFVAQLKLEQSADTILFQATGLDRSNQFMEAVVNAGLDAAATLDDWSNLHRALTGQVELAILHGNFGGATTYLTLQVGYYNALESDYQAALETARQNLEMQKKHQPGLLPFGYTAIGDAKIFAMACPRTSPMRTGSCANTKSSSKGAMVSIIRRWRSIW